ncbi:MAG TPA: sigma-70 family RNA polymerase sigma factor [Vicinamibacterales bacterium]|nr:sigma-70 family RNA polymerase sigma factor [Vicinamibacterales bacterium]
MTLNLEGLYAEHRQFLWALCYRMTGNAADADDAVQDTFVRALQHPPRRTETPLRPWLVRVALNLSRDLLRKRRRRDYVGPWLPSPIETGEDADPPSHEPSTDGATTLEGRYDLLESVSFAFLLAIETLTPTQRAVLLLRDVFDYSVKETADALDRSQANVKTTHHRARQSMDAYNRNRQTPTRERQAAAGRALRQFLERLAAHDVAGIEALLADEVRTTTDGGGEFRAALRPIVGREKVMRFYLAIVELTRGAAVRSVTLNGGPGVVVEAPTLPKERMAPRTAMTLELDAVGRISHLYVVSATRKLSAVSSESQRL